MRKILLTFATLLTAITACAIDITRYVAEGGTGDGLSKENPTGDLLKVLQMSKSVESVTVYLAPGKYDLPAKSAGPNDEVYGRVCLYGGGGDGSVADLENKSIITGDLRINGGVVMNIDFRGSHKKGFYSNEGYINDTYGELNLIGANIFYCRANRLVTQGIDGNTQYIIGVKGQTARVGSYKTHYNDYGPQPFAVIADCEFSGGEGLEVGIRANVSNCRLNNNSGTGLAIRNSGLATNVTDCEIIGNKGKGGVAVEGTSDDPVAVFARCVISGNVSSDNEYCSAISGRAPYAAISCLIAENRSEVTSKTGSYNNYRRYLGAVMLERASTRFVNCTFYDNKDAAIYYWMEGDHGRVANGHFSNCVFLGNGKPWHSYNKNEPVISNCATDFGSEIPELDAERKLVRITKATAGMDVIDGRRVEIHENSPLINSGVPELNLDIDKISHLMLGGTDMGCKEYTGNWTKSTPELKFSNESVKYLQIESEFRGGKYYAMIPPANISADGIPELSYSIYLDNKLRAPKLGGADAIAVYLSLDGRKYAVQYNKQFAAPWLRSYDWVIQKIEPYTTAAPVLEKNASGNWILKQGTPAKTATRPKKRTVTNTKRRR